MDEKTAEFIEKAKAIHGDLYSYEKALFTTNSKKLTITCQVHGDFEQSPSDHFKRHCPKCSKEAQNRAKFEKASMEFIQKIEAVHKDRYDLTKVNYTGARQKIVVGCLHHGFFEITAQHFLAGSGCKKCGRKSASNKTIHNASETFADRAKLVHGDKFSYERVHYEGNTKRVEIVCPIHGSYWQTPRKHLEGSGCHSCSLDNAAHRLTTEKFIEKAKAVHGDKYDYTKTKFTKSHEQIIIICKGHGEFLQNPHNHLAGAGCKLCADESLTYTTAEFIEKANKKHGESYSYESTHYVSAKEKVEITCSTHGAFYQKPILHLQGYGCTRCAAEKRARKTTSTTAEFVKSANFVHDYKWSYDKTIYVNSHEKVIITCKEHGDFEQLPISHKRGRGCPKCGKLKSAEAQRLSLEQFIANAGNVHGDRYIYDLVDYSSYHEKVSIKCLIHGIFFQSPSSHLAGAGCPGCGYEVARKKTRIPQEAIIEKAALVHGDKYAYSINENYTSNKTLLISCPEHGKFERVAEAHLRGVGCPKCIKIKRNLQTEEFIERAQKIHKGRYGYDYVKCNGTNTLLKIECFQHGIFEQKASQHLRGSGCRACYVDSTKLNLERYLDDCRQAHDNKYDYSKLSLSTIRDKVIIGCPTHGDFLQTAHDHKHGAGCPRCAEYYRNLDNKDPLTPCYLYYLRLQTDRLIFYKVGITTRGVATRFSMLKQDNTAILEEYSILTTLHKAINAEQTILEEFNESRLSMSDTLKLTGGGTECFNDDVLGIHGLELEDYL